MGLISSEVEVRLCSRNIEYYEDLGYIIPRVKGKWGVTVPRGTKIKVKVEDLQPKSKAMVYIQCDSCGLIKETMWQVYTEYVNEDNTYYCNKCALKLYGSEKARKTMLENSISFKEWCNDNNHQEILDRWDYELNKCNPDEVSFATSKHYYFKCSKGIHKSELKNIHSFTTGKGSLDCAICKSLGFQYPDVFKVWSDRNKKSPYEYTSFSSKRVWWKCPENKHKDFKRKISESNRYNFRCPECNYSKGEETISNFLKNNNVYYESQKIFDGLTGLGGSYLSYDFYLPQYNLLIEYQGEFHDGNGNYYIKKNLKKQQEHDCRKREYVKNNNISLLEIWYYDFDNIEEILEEKLSLFESDFLLYKEDLL